MKERKCYEVPSITVISMDAHNDIIQTSTVTEPVGLEALTTTYTQGVKSAGGYDAAAKSLWSN